VNEVLLEHLVMRIDDEGRLELQTGSTSWRWAPHGVILTFVHVFPDASAGSATLGPDAAQRFTALDLEALPVTCHAVRHLHFLVRTDAEIAEIAGYDRFWAFAAEVADHHYPAVAGLLPDAPEYQI
jgi:hypothetical protein